MNRNHAAIDIAVQFALILTIVLRSVLLDLGEGQAPFFALGLWQVVSAVIRKTHHQHLASVYFKGLGWAFLLLGIIGLLASVAEGVGAGIIVCGFGMLLIGTLGAVGYFFACLDYFIKN